MKEQDLIKLIGVTAELTGQVFSEMAIEVMLEDLQNYSPDELKQAFTAIRKQGLKLTIGNVVKNIPDGRPGVEEAWSMIPRGESETTVWTREMREAYGVAAPLLHSGDQIGARMAFKEKYESLLTQAKTNSEPIQWHASLGFDQKTREETLIRAMEQGKLPPATVRAYLPTPSDLALKQIEAMENNVISISTVKARGVINA